MSSVAPLPAHFLSNVVVSNILACIGWSQKHLHLQCLCCYSLFHTCDVSIVRLPGPYKASLLKAFQRTVEEARFTFVIVDANNLTFEDFKAFWSVGQV